MYVCVCAGIYIGYLLLLQFVPQGCARCELSQEAKNKISLWQGAKMHSALHIGKWQKTKKRAELGEGAAQIAATSNPQPNPLSPISLNMCICVFTVKNCANEQLLLV